MSEGKLDRLAMKAEEEVQRSIQRAMAKFNIPVYVFRGVNTNDAVGKFLQSFDIKMSKLKGFKPGEKKNRSLECEHDIGALALLPTGPLASFVQVVIPVNSHYMYFLQVKTNESDTPWDPKPESDQKVEGSSSRKLYSDALDQLDRDVLRFLELVPDIQMATVKIATNVAFPLAPASSERALTKDDFSPDNAAGLLEKLGVPRECLQDPRGPPSRRADDEETYKKMICRYLGAHSQIPAKISMEKGLRSLNLAVRSTEAGLGVEATASTFDREEVDNMRKAVAKDKRMREIRSATEIHKFGKKFQDKNIDIPLNDLKADKDRFLKQVSTNTFPLYGLPVIKAVLKAVDEEVAHQGSQAIISGLVKEKYVFFDENGIPLDHRKKVDEHIQGCTDCSEVQKIKDKVIPPASATPVQNPEDIELGVQSNGTIPAHGILLQIPEDVEPEVLLFADNRHQGFAEAHRRVKTWVDLPDLKRKVHTINIYEVPIHVNFQIREHTAVCPACGARTAHLLLSAQQRRAISRRHHLKFITGHYGSGKVYIIILACISS